MKFVVFGPDARIGALDGDEVVDLHAADPTIPPVLAAFIEAGVPALDAAAKAVQGGTARRPASGIQLHAPWPRRRIACAGGNFAAHSYGMAINSGVQGVTIETQAKRIRDDGLWGFWKNLIEVAGPDDSIPHPKRATYFDYEGEVAIVIGKRGKDIPPEQFTDYVWGVTLAVDWSIRDPEHVPQRPVSFNFAKNFDSSASLGPCIVVAEVDPENLDVETRVAGELRQRYNSKEMVYSFGELLAYISRDFTVVPGDIIFGGTGAGTAQDSTKLNPYGSRSLDRFLRAGQVVEVSSPRIGTLKSTVV